MSKSLKNEKFWLSSCETSSLNYKWYLETLAHVESLASTFNTDA